MDDQYISLHKKVKSLLTDPEKHKTQLDNDWHLYVTVDGVEYLVTYWHDINQLTASIAKPRLEYTFHESNPAIDFSNLIIYSFYPRCLA
tara:strand:+ start:734 stop:1000 length:267 start_codon:yes stop_codon:yes gene_type:complete